ncbi:hypothetical protein L484_002112 [Morus notabilis]|uniref:Uncharacterized protein n=1 Tax=Morus notabilis TaxID=981085 RepID=W9QTB9_9ROSA|nr:hypothetical protein L484_002112 [Morus notabilis]
MITTTTAPIHHGNDYHIDPSLLPFKKRRRLYDHYHEKEGDDRQSNKSSGTTNTAPIHHGNGYLTDPSLLPLKKRHRFYDHHHEKGDDHSQEVLQSNKSSSTTTAILKHGRSDGDDQNEEKRNTSTNQRRNNKRVENNPCIALVNLTQRNVSSSTTTGNVYHQTGDSEPRSDVAA